MKLLAIQTSCTTGEERQVELEAEIRNGHDGEPWLYITKGGVTGYESAKVSALLRHGPEIPDWNACWGTKNRWDTLVVSGDSLTAALAGATA